MIKLILMGLLAYFAIKWVRRSMILKFYRPVHEKKVSGSEMVKCVKCDTYIIKDIAVHENGGWRCPNDCA